MFKKKGENEIPPPPQLIFEELNGHLIGHYIMKKSLCVAVYNHFCDVNMKRKMEQNETQSTDSGIGSDEDCGNHTDDEMKVIRKKDERKMSLERCILERNLENRSRKTSKDSGIGTGTSPTAETAEYMTPIVSRVLIEASTHRVRLRKTNILTFDSTGSSKPLEAIAMNVARFLKVPFVRIDCRSLTSEKMAKFERIKAARGNKNASNGEMSASIPAPQCQKNKTKKQQPQMAAATAAAHPNDADDDADFIDDADDEMSTPAFLARRRSLQAGCLRQLLQGNPGETISNAVAKIFKLANYDRSKAEKAIIMLDAMDNLGSGSFCDDPLQSYEVRVKELVGEVLRLIDGARIDVRRPSRHEGEQDTMISLSTAHMFFICFGVNNDNINAELSSHNVNNTNAQSDAINTEKRRRRQYEEEDSLESIYGESFCSEDYDYDDDDDSFQGLKANKMAQLLLDSQKNLIQQCQDLWGMQDVELKITPEALEVISNQALYQNAGKDGVRNILEKLLMTVKFDIMDEKDDIEMVEITEEYIIGKEPPVVHYRTFNNSRRSRRTHGDEDHDDDHDEEEEVEEEEEDISKKRQPYQFTEFEEDLYQQLEDIF